MSPNTSDHTASDAPRRLDANEMRRMAEGGHANQSPLRRFLRTNRPALGALAL